MPGLNACTGQSPENKKREFPQTGNSRQLFCLRRYRMASTKRFVISCGRVMMDPTTQL